MNMFKSFSSVILTAAILPIAASAADANPSPAPSTESPVAERAGFDRGTINRPDYYSRDRQDNVPAAYDAGVTGVPAATVPAVYPGYYPGAYVPPDPNFMPGETEANDIYKANQHRPR